MKTKLLIFSAFFLTCCNSQKDVSQKKMKQPEQEENKERLDSAKWYFYAYNFEGTGLFKKNGEVSEFKPSECEAQIMNVSKKEDSTFYNIELHKEGYKFLYIKDGFTSSGFYYHDGVFTPETGMIRLDNFDNSEYVRKNNLKVDSIFKAFLKRADTSKIFNWLKIESKKRKIF